MFAGRQQDGLVACTSGSDCESGRCYDSFCSEKQIEGVSGIDILYADFQTSLTSTMGAWAREQGVEDRGCFRGYDCPADWLPGSETCETQCYLFDSAGLVIVDPLFLEVDAAAEAEYSSVSLGERAGPVMLDLLRRGFARRMDSIDYQGTCDITRPEDRIPTTLEGLSLTAEESDNLARTRGDFSEFDNTYGCV